MFKAIALFCFIFTLSVVAQQEAAVPAPQALGCFVCDAGNTLFDWFDVCRTRPKRAHSGRPDSERDLGWQCDSQRNHCPG